VLAEALDTAGSSGRDLAAIGIANQRETSIIWDRATGKPIAPAIVWQDRRTSDACSALRASGLGARVRERTGLVIDPYFSATKIAWLLDNVPGARRRAERGELAFGTVDSWLIWNLTAGAVHATDVSNASRTMLFDIARIDWDDELLGVFNIPRSLLPEVRPSVGAFGEVASGPAAGVPIFGVAGDQQAALAGQGCVEPGSAKNTYGTGCFMLMQTGGTPKISEHRLVTTVAWQRAGRPACYALEGSVFIGGAAVQWLRDGLGIIRSASECDDRAATVPDSGGCVLVPAFAGLGAPDWEASARGALLGITRGTTAAHVCRATLEGIACSVADLASAMVADGGAPMRELRVDGGAARSDLLMQMQADLLRVPVVRPGNTESTAKGAACLAGLGVGVLGSFGDFCANADRRVFEPVSSDAQAAATRGRWRDAVERTKGWADR
jgi:glycerol kinase